MNNVGMRKMWKGHFDICIQCIVSVGLIKREREKKQFIFDSIRTIPSSCLARSSMLLVALILDVDSNEYLKFILDFTSNCLRSFVVFVWIIALR